MIEVDYGGGGTAHGWERSTDQLVCLWGATGHVYKGVEEVERAGPYGAPWGSPTPTGSRIHPLPSSRGRRQGRGRGKRRKEGVPPLPLVQFGLVIGGGAACLSLSPLKPNKAHILPGKFP